MTTKPCKQKNTKKEQLSMKELKRLMGDTTRTQFLRDKSNRK
ncbi:hypothetical protein [Brevibacillus laterosporus]|uniref:Uncharacterized protein n=1 Tax=Brevibacillus laterosporus TaxID=1465 RepID=A0AAP3DLM4_BRELA|nr:hypothetical protein [Brevibacillus laterosporus]MCR8983212.1 hypothetical protein [Brevibacillus laterosporus]MCZ0810368.1 hypothetical protein [Brevibacillus laterosporus]MCZ0828256.1 hypothetical protein [Brevibacillus laterosporus]MCZ0853094.1 hypothetical protein [Brevibacillus laterosporus]